MILVWCRWSMNRTIQATIFCLHIKRNRCTTEVILMKAWKNCGWYIKLILKCTLIIWWIHGKTWEWWCHWRLSRRNWMTPKFHGIWRGGTHRMSHMWRSVNGRRIRSFKEMPMEIKMHHWKTRKEWITWCTCRWSRFRCWRLMISKIVNVVVR
jgi:hypothetical protein